MTTTTTRTASVDAVREGRDDLPHALTFFLTGAQRRAVLSKLRRHNAGDRADALLRALRLDGGKGASDAR